MRNTRKAILPLHLPTRVRYPFILLGMLIAITVAQGADTRPNILLIYTDDHSHDNPDTNQSHQPHEHVAQAMRSG